MINIKYSLLGLVLLGIAFCSVGGCWPFFGGSEYDEYGYIDASTDIDSDTDTDTDVDTDTDTDTDTDPDCTSGICCSLLTGTYRPSTYPCDVTTAYSCTSSDCGADAQEKDTTQYCSGTSELCNGSTVLGGWIMVDDCATDAICEYDTIDSWCTVCPGGCIMGACDPACIPSWTERTVEWAFDGAVSVYVADVDGDGDLDMLGAAVMDNEIGWWENTAGDGTAWTGHTVDGAFAGARFVYAADVDGDGDMDVLGAAYEDDDITWWENTAGDGTAWTEHTIDGAFGGAVSVHAEDVDGDGDMDVIGAAYDDDGITWLENTAGDGTAWTEHTVDGAFGGAASVHAGDIDGDGDMDVIGMAYDDGDIAWWESNCVP